MDNGSVVNTHAERHPVTYSGDLTSKRLIEKYFCVLGDLNLDEHLRR